jgi:Icc-related predicted phosphoesterase
MQIAYLSDLHLEFERAPSRFDLQKSLVPAAGADLVVLAGDIDVGERGIETADSIAKFTGVPVVYVAGNHEAYGHDLAALEPRLRRAAWNTDGRVVYLNCNVARFWFGGEPLVVLGCTLWTDYALSNDGELSGAEITMHDHQQILLESGPFRPSDAQSFHRKHRFWLDAQLKKIATENPRPRILAVTHHAPIPQALGKRAAAIAKAYASDLQSEIASWPPLFWIHGHTHHRHETRVGASTVVSAPRGYPGDAIDEYVCGILDI